MSNVGNENIFLFKNHLHLGLTKSTLKRFEYDIQGQKNVSRLRALTNPLASPKWVPKNYFIFADQ